MNSFESLLLNSGFSWTNSKVIPYASMILIGIISIVLLKRILKLKSKWIKFALQTVFFVLPFVLYFMIAPIYEGDFSNNSVQVMKSNSMEELTGKKLYVLSIPNCPYCYEAIGRMKVLKERVPSAKIEYVVCSSDSINAASYLEWYSSEAGELINVRLANNVEEMAKLADHAFPTFVLVDGNKPLKKWNNDSFGVVAMDEVEELLK